MDTQTVFVKDTTTSGPDTTREFYSRFLDALREHDLLVRVKVVRAADLGYYGQGMVVKILPDDILYHNVQYNDIERIVSKTLQNKQVIEDLLYHEKPKQIRIVLRNCGTLDPESLNDYIGNDGYQSLSKIISEYTPEQVIDELKKSGLRGRGGAGYPTWMKWQSCRSTPSDLKYVICNADEGDPGAYMDRSILEGDPHSVIEGLIIAAYTIGASKGYFYIRAEYPLAIQRVQKAIDQCYEAGLLGKNIQDSQFSFDIDIRFGAGAFVCGEETALLASIEGKRGTPRPRPPYPAQKGLWGQPTVINNVETLACVPYILYYGGDNFAKIGTPTSKGTKVFAITGKIKNSGLVEVPMGISLREIIYDICGGTISGKAVKAVQTGGPSGGVIPDKLLDAPVDYENLAKMGSIIGSGGMIVMDTSDCMVDIAKFYLGFCVSESCGKCAPCRIGCYQMQVILDRITEGKGQIEDIENLRNLAQAVQKSSLCGLGQSAPNPVLSTLNYFEEEYKDHILNKHCQSGKCVHLLTFTIQAEKCKRCSLCTPVCPVNAIHGSRETGYEIDQSACIKCGKCEEVCKFKAIFKV
ncbi:MAG TPA: NADH-ubiquinone oxidoreductase-F iron-sulfur binding region domain-containing protein [Dehalococcoidales bacterium]|nr:NADH-ubiquinone oxidoreductase-F iron-sulfur binding region domain-containing protein [Dehalococcoidales bacterium]